MAERGIQMGSEGEGTIRQQAGMAPAQAETQGEPKVQVEGVTETLEETKKAFQECLGKNNLTEAKKIADEHLLPREVVVNIVGQDFIKRFATPPGLIANREIFRLQTIFSLPLDFFAREDVAPLLGDRIDASIKRNDGRAANRLATAFGFSVERMNEFARIELVDRLKNTDMKALDTLRDFPTIPELVSDPEIQKWVPGFYQSLLETGWSSSAKKIQDTFGLSESVAKQIAKTVCVAAFESGDVDLGFKRKLDFGIANDVFQEGTKEREAVLRSVENEVYSVGKTFTHYPRKVGAGYVFTKEMKENFNLTQPEIKKIFGNVIIREVKDGDYHSAVRIKREAVGGTAEPIEMKDHQQELVEIIIRSSTVDNLEDARVAVEEFIVDPVQYPELIGKFVEMIKAELLIKPYSVEGWSDKCRESSWIPKPQEDGIWGDTFARLGEFQRKDEDEDL